MTVFDAVKKVLLAGVGAQEKVKEVMDELVKKGEISDSQGAKLIKEWTEQAEKGTSEFSKSISDTLTKAMEKMNLPKKDDIDKLSEQIKVLGEKVKALEEKQG